MSGSQGARHVLRGRHEPRGTARAAGRRDRQPPPSKRRCAITWDAEGRAFFASRSARIGDHEIHIVVSLDADALERVPQLGLPADPGSQAGGGINAIIFELLDQAHRELYTPDAGHVGVGGFSYDAPEISLRAIRRMLRTALHLAG